MFRFYHAGEEIDIRSPLKVSSTSLSPILVYEGTVMVELCNTYTVFAESLKLVEVTKGMKTDRYLHVKLPDGALFKMHVSNDETGLDILRRLYSSKPLFRFHLFHAGKEIDLCLPLSKLSSTTTQASPVVVYEGYHSFIVRFHRARD